MIVVQSERIRYDTNVINTMRKGEFAMRAQNLTLLTDLYELTMMQGYYENPGAESPWGGAQLTFIARRDVTPQPPQTPQALLEFAKANPGTVKIGRASCRERVLRLV